MGGSASYRYGKKIANARANGASEQEIAELERKRQEAIAREKLNAKKNAAPPHIVRAGAKALYSGSTFSGSQGEQSVLAPESNGMLDKMLGVTKRRAKETDEFSKDKIARINKDVFNELDKDTQEWATNKSGVPKMTLDENSREVTIEHTYESVLGEMVTVREHADMYGNIKGMGLNNNYKVTGHGRNVERDFAEAFVNRLEKVTGKKFSIEKAPYDRALEIRDENGKVHNTIRY